MGCSGDVLSREAVAASMASEVTWLHLDGFEVSFITETEVVGCRQR